MNRAYEFIIFDINLKKSKILKKKQAEMFLSLKLSVLSSCGVGLVQPQSLCVCERDGGRRQ